MRVLSKRMAERIASNCRKLKLLKKSHSNIEPTRNRILKYVNAAISRGSQVV